MTFVRVLPSPDQVHEIKELARTDRSVGEVVTAVFGPPKIGSHRRQAVKAIIADPDAFDPDVDRVAVELNLEILAKDEFGTKYLHEGDRIEILSFIGGGAA